MHKNKIPIINFIIYTSVLFRIVNKAPRESDAKVSEKYTIVEITK